MIIRSGCRNYKIRCQFLLFGECNELLYIRVSEKKKSLWTETPFTTASSRFVTVGQKRDFLDVGNRRYGGKIINLREKPEEDTDYTRSSLCLTQKPAEADWLARSPDYSHTVVCKWAAFIADYHPFRRNPQVQFTVEFSNLRSNPLMKTLLCFREL